MKNYKIISLVSALCLMVIPVNFSAYADDAIKQTPVYNEFDENEVNGTVTVNIPENVTAHIAIDFDSPEVTNEPYYIADVDGGNSYSFDIEGRDNTEADYRYYNISISLTGGEYGFTSEPFTDRTNVLDANDNPDKFTEYIYNFTVDDKTTDSDWDITSEKGTEKSIAVHLDGIMLGDINNDGIVDANDSSIVLAEYAVLSTGEDSTFTQREQQKADVTMDSAIDANDASKILAYYSENSTGGNASWDNV
ncbi:MAG: hypothetical protein K2O60_01590 [Ruminococcus sp.]|nr:hypothetical protein [Ruminococcus sp.]